jgi:hypothetical protein
MDVRLFLVGVLLTGHCATSALVSHWTFDEGSGTTAYDSAGASHGTLSATGASFVPGGVLGGAVSLARGSGGYVSFPGQSFVGVDFSITAWFQTTDSANETFLLSKHNAGFPNGYFIPVNVTGSVYGAAGRAAFYTGAAPANTPVSTSVVTDGAWHFLAAVHHEGGFNEIYIDGIPYEDARTSASVGASTASFLLGALTMAGSPVASFTGLIDDVRIFSHALAPAEVAALYSLVPEPASLALAALAGLLLPTRRWPAGARA